jgi:hypothetical protein
MQTALMATSTPPATDSSQATYNDPTSTYVNTSTLDFLLIELVPMAYRITTDLAAREETWMRGSGEGSSSGAKGGATDADGASTSGGRGEAASGVGGTNMDEEEAREAVFHRLEGLGYRVGLGVVERYVVARFPLDFHIQHSVQCEEETPNR